MTTPEQKEREDYARQLMHQTRILEDKYPQDAKELYNKLTGLLLEVSARRDMNAYLATHNDELAADNAALRRRVEALEVETAWKDVVIANLREACKEALWRLEQYNYSAMKLTIERLRTVLKRKEASDAD